MRLPHKHELEEGQALAEYWPTIAGFIFLPGIIFLHLLTPIVEVWYQDTIDGLVGCNRGVGNYEELCDPGKSYGKGEGEGRPAGEDRAEDEGPPGQQTCTPPACTEIVGIDEGIVLADNVCEVVIKNGSYLIGEGYVSWSGKNVKSVEIWYCE